jgi:DNA helicase-2/ATP-dependent DNA helicase PcrA
MVDEASLLFATRGSVVAPAGCGKTELIARAVRAPNGGGTLILTHTHAGVKAIRDRLTRLGVDRRRARVETIAGWCLRYGRAYPGMAQLASIEPVKQEWDSVYDGAVRLLQTRALQGVVRATYSRVLVDEYQDCTARQHAVVLALADCLPTCVLGDPLQGIFGFAGGCLPWSGEVEVAFPSLGTLAEPWRWKGKNEPLGQWLLDLREPLTSGREIDLSAGPLTWRVANPDNQRKAAYGLAKEPGPVVAIRKWPKDAHSFARILGGYYPSMEETDCNDLLGFADDMDTLAGTSRAARLLRFAGECFTEIGSALASPLEQLDKGILPNAARYPKVGVAVAFLVDVATGNGPAEVVRAMRGMENLPDAKLFRRELWREAIKTFVEFERGGAASIRQAAWILRNRHRANGRAVDPRSVSRTLLIKGLEFDHALVLSADEFEDPKKPGDGARNFYVAATRGARSLVVLSAAARIRFSKPSL